MPCAAAAEWYASGRDPIDPGRAASGKGGTAAEAAAVCATN